MTDLRLISADSHICEPPDLWEKRLPSEMREKGPRMVRAQRGDSWTVQGKLVLGLGLGSMAQQNREKFQFEKYQAATPRWEEVLPSAYDPRARLADQDVDHVTAEVIYPTAGLVIFDLVQLDIHAATVRAYNDWLAEFCSHSPERLIGLSVIPSSGIEDAVAELRRARALGMRGVVLQNYPNGGMKPTDVDEAFWAEADALRMPVSIHQVFNKDPGLKPGANFLVNHSLAFRGVQMVLANLVYTGVLQRHPGLKLVTVESDIGWVPHLKQRLDWSFQRHRWHRRSDLQMKPSEFLERQAYHTFMEDKIGIENRRYIGAERILWASDFPHSDSTWPRSLEAVNGLFPEGDGGAEGDKRKIAFDNARALYAIRVET